MVESVHWVSLAAALLVAFVYFRDLGDITQAVFDVSLDRLLFAIRYETWILSTGIGFLLVAVTTFVFFPVGHELISPLLSFAVMFMLGFPWIWIHVGLRHQQSTARFFSIAEASKRVRPETSVLVIEHNGVARAHPDHEIKRPHLAGNDAGLDGENVIMTYCAMSHLGMAIKPEINASPVSLEVAAQHGNNLIMRDASSGLSIRQIHSELNDQPFERWPTFRMSFRGFAKAFPNGEVFLNPITPFLKNPLLFLFDHIVETIMLWGLTPHHNTEDLLFETMDYEDDRLPRKTLVWGIKINDESVAFTEEFIRHNLQPINTIIGGESVVITWDKEYESIGIYYNNTGAPVTQVDFNGRIDDSRKLERVEAVSPGLYWFVWVNFFPETLLNSVLQQENNELQFSLSNKLSPPRGTGPRPLMPNPPS